MQRFSNNTKHELRLLNIPHQTCGSSSSHSGGTMREGRPFTFSLEASAAYWSFLFPVSISLISKLRLWLRCHTLQAAGRQGTGERQANPGWHAITSSVARWQCWRKWSGAHLCAFACVFVWSMYCSTMGIVKETLRSLSTLMWVYNHFCFELVSWTVLTCEGLCD